MVEAMAPADVQAHQKEFMHRVENQVLNAFMDGGVMLRPGSITVTPDRQVTTPQGKQEQLYRLDIKIPARVAGQSSGMAGAFSISGFMTEGASVEGHKGNPFIQDPGIIKINYGTPVYARTRDGRDVELTRSAMDVIAVSSSTIEVTGLVAVEGRTAGLDPSRMYAVDIPASRSSGREEVLTVDPTPGSLAWVDAGIDKSVATQTYQR